MPENIVGPWDLGKLQKPPAYEILRLRRVRDFDRNLTVSEIYFETAPFLGRPARAFGWLAMPESPSGKLPAMLLLHGGGGTAVEHWARQWASRGFAAMAIDLYGQGPDCRRLPDGGCDWSDLDLAFEYTRGVENHWIYQSVATSIRAVAALRALPEINPSKVGVTGVSWGGYLTHTIMCVDDTVSLGIPACGCGFNKRIGTKSSITTPDKCAQTFRLFDGSSYSHRCNKPVLWVGGVADPPPDELMKSFRAIGHDRQTLSIRNVPHHNQPAYMGTAFDQLEPFIFADSVFGSGTPMPRVGSPWREGRQIIAACETEIPLFSASVQWTQNTVDPWLERKWQGARATIDGANLIAEIDTDSPVIAHLLAFDMRGVLSSSTFLGID